MAQAAFIDPAELAKRQAARRAATAASATPSGGWNQQAPSIEPTNAPAQAVRTPKYGSQAIADKVSDIGNRAAAFRKDVQASNIGAQVSRAPGLQPGAPAGASTPISARPTIEPATITSAEMARNNPTSAFARNTPGAAFDTAAPGNLSQAQVARANYGVGRAAGTNPGVATPTGPSFSGQAAAPAGGPTIEPAAAPRPAAAPTAGATPAAAEGAGMAARAGGVVRRVVGLGGKALGVVGGGVQAAEGISDIAQHGADVGNVGDTLAGSGAVLASTGALGALGTAAAPLTLAAAGGWGVGRALEKPVSAAADRMSGVGDTIGGTVNGIVRGAGELIGQKWGASREDEQALTMNNLEYARAHPPAAAPAAGSAATIDPSQLMAENGTPPGRPDIAMQSDRPGTAVIDGHVYTPKEIADAGKRLNTVPSTAFTNASIGDLYSQTHGGATPTTEQAMAFRAAQGGSGPAGGGVGNGGSFGDDRASILADLRAQAKQRNSEMRRLTSASETALARGKKRAAGILANLAGQYSGSPDMSAYLPQQGKQVTPGEEMLQSAQAANYAANADATQTSTAQQKRLAAITDALGTETDPGRRDTLLKQAGALTGGKGERPFVLDVPGEVDPLTGQAGKLQMLVAPDGTVIYDPRGVQTGKKTTTKG